MAFLAQYTLIPELVESLQGHGLKPILPLWMKEFQSSPAKRMKSNEGDPWYGEEANGEDDYNANATPVINCNNVCEWIDDYEVCEVICEMIDLKAPDCYDCEYDDNACFDICEWDDENCQSWYCCDRWDDTSEYCYDHYFEEDGMCFDCGDDWYCEMWCMVYDEFRFGFF